MQKCFSNYLLFDHTMSSSKEIDRDCVRYSKTAKNLEFIVSAVSRSTKKFKFLFQVSNSDSREPRHSIAL